MRQEFPSLPRKGGGQGTALGKVLGEIRDGQLDGEIKTKTQALKYAKKLQ